MLFLEAKLKSSTLALLTTYLNSTCSNNSEMAFDRAIGLFIYICKIRLPVLRLHEINFVVDLKITNMVSLYMMIVLLIKCLDVT